MCTNDWKTNEPLNLQKQLDYIFYEKSKLAVAWDVQLPVGDEVQNLFGDKNLPNKFHPSDHLPLCCNFYFK